MSLQSVLMAIYAISLMFSITAGQKILVPTEISARTEVYPPCKACRVLAESFNYGMEHTKRGKHAGGDAAWENKKLRAYKVSEVRLAEIQEKICIDVMRGQEQCLTLAADVEAILEHWFLNKQIEAPNLLDWLCIETLKVCCPDGHYGKECKKCHDCNGNGKCKGYGTRKGNGKCRCDAAYAGEFCEKCSDTHYESFRDETKFLCSPCHTACDVGGCTGPGPKSCRKCKEGWQMDSETGCNDINECIDVNPPVCTPQQFCVNREGHYHCIDCDRSCNGCDGDGPDMCLECAEGYTLKNNKCDDGSSKKGQREVNVARLLTYFGLCVATCVIFQSSATIAYIVGAAVAIYIAASEYWLGYHPNAPLKPLINADQLEEMLMKSF